MTDWLDGYLAKKLNQKTVLGAFLDPMADKVLIGALTLGRKWRKTTMDAPIVI
jgi:phosphatidylglycerophosphate synthase